MTRASFPLCVSYHQLCIFDSTFERPFNDWADQHIRQGFSWRPGSVAFLTIDDELYIIELDITQNIELSPEAPRVIQTPFNVPPSGRVEVGSISESKLIDLPAGMYQLQFECFAPQEDADGNIEHRIRLTFARSDNPSFKILRADAVLNPGDDLLLTTEPV